MSSARTGSRPRVPRPSASISSPIQRASSSPSQWPISRTFSPCGHVGPERLAEALLVGGDHPGGGGEDVRGRAVVLLEPDHLRAGEVALEAQDVADLGAAPAVDRLVVVADDGDVAVPGGEQPQPEVLRDVGVLVLVDQDVAEPALVALQHVRVAPGRSSRRAAGGRRSRRRSASSAAPGTRRRARSRGGRRRSPPTTAPARAAAPGSSSRRSGSPAAAAASASRRCCAASTIWRSSRSWSSVSRMVKFDFSPTSSACRRRILTDERVEGAEPGHALDDVADEAARPAPSSRAPPCW